MLEAARQGLDYSDHDVRLRERPEDIVEHPVPCQGETERRRVLHRVHPLVLRRETPNWAEPRPPASEYLKVTGPGPDRPGQHT